VNLRQADAPPQFHLAPAALFPRLDQVVAHGIGYAVQTRTPDTWEHIEL
jgi:hypothetical protein